MAEIVLRNLTKRFPNGVEAVRDLSLDIGEGEFLVLVGPSGCGKTTALRMIAGLEDITSGDLYIGGRRVNDLLERDRDIAMVFQNYALYPHMTVAQNIAFSLKLARRPRHEIKERVRQTAHLLGLEPYLDRRPKALSGGQRQRVAMGRAIIREPQAFLMDEPLSNLDAQLRVHMRGEIESLQKRLGVTTVYVTHDQIEAMTMGDRVAVLRDGMLQQVDTPSTLYDWPVNLFVAGFIGSPAMNFAVATIERGDGGLHLLLAGAVIPIPADVSTRRGLDAWVGRSVVVGIRPEDMHAPQDRRPEHGTGTLPVTIDRVETVGTHVLGYFTVDAPAPKTESVALATGSVMEDVPLFERVGTPFCAAFEPRSTIGVGDDVDVVIDGRRLHFFDQDSEQAIGV